jgi:hypothetical protein
MRKWGYMRLGCLALWLSLCLAAATPTPMTVDKLVTFLRNAVTSTDYKYTDLDLAGFLANVKMTERLEDHTIEELQGQIRLGPKTLARLRMLRDQSQSLVAGKVLPPPLPPKPIPPPSAEEQAAILDEVRDYALTYSQSLPDFICTQVTTRFGAPLPGTRYGGAVGDAPHWQQFDRLTIRLSYFQQHEDYKLILQNNTPTQVDYAKVGGSRSYGDFNSVMLEIFERRAETHFEWDHWGTLRGKRVMAFAYRIPLSNSDYHIGVEDQKLSITVGRHGLVEVDKETHKIMRVTSVADDIPANFPIKKVESTLDYDYVELSGRTFLLPLKGNTIATASDNLQKLENEFRIYRKYEAESTISFGDETNAPPVSDDKTKETVDPVQPPPPPKKKQ